MAEWVYLHNLDPFAIPLYGDFGIRWYGLAYITAFLVGNYFLLLLLKRTAPLFLKKIFLVWSIMLLSVFLWEVVWATAFFINLKAGWNGVLSFPFGEFWKYIREVWPAMEVFWVFFWLFGSFLTVENILFFIC